MAFFGDLLSSISKYMTGLCFLLMIPLVLMVVNRVFSPATAAPLPHGVGLSAFLIGPSVFGLAAFLPNFMVSRILRGRMEPRLWPFNALVAVNMLAVAALGAGWYRAGSSPVIVKLPQLWIFFLPFMLVLSVQALLALMEVRNGG